MKQNQRNKRLTKSPHNKMLAGVCGGIGDYFNIDPTLIRILYALFLVFTGFFPMLILYILFAIIMPEKGNKFR